MVMSQTDFYWPSSACFVSGCPYASTCFFVSHLFCHGQIELGMPVTPRSDRSLDRSMEANARVSGLIEWHSELLAVVGETREKEVCSDDHFFTHSFFTSID